LPQTPTVVQPVPFSVCSLVDTHTKHTRTGTEQRQRDRQTGRQQTNRQTDRQTGRQTDRQTDKQTDRQTDRQTDTQEGGAGARASGRITIHQRARRPRQGEPLEAKHFGRGRERTKGCGGARGDDGADGAPAHTGSHDGQTAEHSSDLFARTRFCVKTPTHHKHVNCQSPVTPPAKKVQTTLVAGVRFRLLLRVCRAAMPSRCVHWLCESPIVRPRSGYTSTNVAERNPISKARPLCTEA
jgi:hypothetical protein